MKFFVTGVGGQLGHDVMNELIKRGHEGVGSDIQEQYSGVEDGSEVTKAPYLSLDITDKEAVKRVIESVKPDAVTTVRHGRPLIWRKMMTRLQRFVRSMRAARRTLRMSARSWTAR